MGSNPTSSESNALDCKKFCVFFSNFEECLAQLVERRADNSKVACSSQAVLICTY